MEEKKKERERERKNKERCQKNVRKRQWPNECVGETHREIKKKE